MSTNISVVHNTITPGDFSFVVNEKERLYYEDAYNAISNTKGGWDFLKSLNSSNDKGPYFWSNPILFKITNNMKLFDNYSGGSFALIMRTMERLAKMGWNDWVSDYKDSHKKNN